MFSKIFQQSSHDGNYIQMENFVVSDDSLEISDETEGPVRTEHIGFAVNVTADQSNFNNDDENLVSSNHHSEVFSDEELQSPVQFRRKPTYDADFWWKASEIEGLGQYDDFHTIDWCRDRARDKMRYRKVRQMKMTGTWIQKIKACDFLQSLFSTFPSVNG